MCVRIPIIKIKANTYTFSDCRKKCRRYEYGKCHLGFFIVFRCVWRKCECFLSSGFATTAYAACKCQESTHPRTPLCETSSSVVDKCSWKQFNEWPLIAYVFLSVGSKNEAIYNNSYIACLEFN